MVKKKKSQMIQMMQMQWTTTTENFTFTYVFCFAQNSFSLLSAYEEGLLFKELLRVGLSENVMGKEDRDVHT